MERSFTDLSWVAAHQAFNHFLEHYVFDAHTVNSRIFPFKNILDFPLYVTYLTRKKSPLCFLINAINVIFLVNSYES